MKVHQPRSTSTNNPRFILCRHNPLAAFSCAHSAHSRTRHPPWPFFSSLKISAAWLSRAAPFLSRSAMILDLTCGQAATVIFAQCLREHNDHI